MHDIDTDIASDHRMLRLVQGDVGSGKTIVAMLAMLSAVESGYQAALMVPTEMLGMQHMQVISTWANTLGITVRFLSSHITSKQRDTILAAIADGSADIIIGTHALIQAHVAFHRLAMIVIDEQHRFGVHQRMMLAEKATNPQGLLPHMLMMTATPIPRSLAMTFYGDMAHSVLDEKPAGRHPIETRMIAMGRIDEVIQGLTRAMTGGNRIYWVCPLIEDDVEHDNSVQKPTNAETRFTKLNAHYPDRIGLVHGAMKAADRTKTMQAFRDSEIDILVATTVIEVGVDVPEATIMVIENAERFGLAQLHQLRGRVGRSDKQSSCLLLYDEKSSDLAKQRLNIMRNHQDGFAIAEEDLRLRGSGDVLGVKQSGMPDFYFADIAMHHDLLITARNEAQHIAQQNPTLQGEHGKALRILLHLFSHDTALQRAKS